MNNQTVYRKEVVLHWKDANQVFTEEPYVAQCSNCNGQNKLTGTAGERMVRDIDSEQETMKEETAIILQMKTIPNMLC